MSIVKISGKTLSHNLLKITFFFSVKHECLNEIFGVCAHTSTDTYLNIYVEEQVRLQII